MFRLRSFLSASRCLPCRGRRASWLGLLLLLGACAVSTSLPGRADPSQLERPPPVEQVAHKVSVKNAGGRLGPAARTALLRRLSEQGYPSLLQRQLAAMAAAPSAAGQEVELYEGNDVRLLLDGPATFQAMFEAIEQAQHLIFLESYIIEDEGVAQHLAELLKKKQAQGVGVAVIYDAVGSIGTDRAYFEDLERAGIQVCQFNPLNPLVFTSYGRITHRDHRKILVTDGQVGFTGGINISSVYTSGSVGRSSGGGGRRHPGHHVDDGWRDTQVRIRGPAVGALEALVRDTWARQSCHGTLPAPSPARATVVAQPQVVRIVAASPDDEVNRIYSLLLTSIDASQRSVYLTMAYFAPGDDMIDALCDAARRGVDVRLVLPSISDFSPVLHAGRHHYEKLLEAGVQLFELRDAVLHAKTAVIDGVVSTVGSSNMDWRSFASNSEVNAVVVGQDFGAAMEKTFRADMAASTPIRLAEWRERPLWQRTKEAMASLFERWW